MTNYGPRYYLRRCNRCSNFMNWRLLNGGAAKCLECDTINPALPKIKGDELEQLIGIRKTGEEK